MAGLLLSAGVLCLLIHLSFGSHQSSLWETAAILLRPDDSLTAFSIIELRLPRALTALLVGASLALAGTIIQAITRNPLGDPGLTGVTSGAAFGAAIVLSFVTVAQGPLIAGAIIGGTIAALFTFILSRRSGFDPLQLVLSGVAVSVLFLALTSAVMIADRAATQTLYFWLIGGFVNRTWLEVSYLWPWVAVGTVCCLLSVRILDLLAFDDATAQNLGVTTGRWRAWLAGLSVVLAAASVAVAGPIGFVGFMAPHLVRSALGQQAAGHKVLLPLAALCGASLTLFADTLSRAIPISRPPPAGVLVTVMGGITFLLLSRRLTGRMA
ncbi:MAG: iron ABC transporter permease [Pseudomonadota bacterium]